MNVGSHPGRIHPRGGRSDSPVGKKVDIAALACCVGIARLLAIGRVIFPTFILRQRRHAVNLRVASLGNETSSRGADNVNTTPLMAVAAEAPVAVDAVMGLARSTRSRRHVGRADFK